MEKSAAPASPPESNDVGADDCELRLLLVSGESFRLVLSRDASVRDVKQRVISEQPAELLAFLKTSGGAPPPASVDEIRLLHLGKLLEDSKSLRDYDFSTGPARVTTVHISCRVPSNTLEDVKDKLNKKSGSCCTLV